MKGHKACINEYKGDRIVARAEGYSSIPKLDIDEYRGMYKDRKEYEGISGIYRRILRGAESLFVQGVTHRCPKLDIEGYIGIYKDRKENEGI